MIHRHTISFKHAFAGMKWALRTQPNYRIHLFLSLLALIGGVVFNITYPEFLTVLTLITVGLTIETINTAIEQTADAIDLKWREDIKIAKDVGAGAMLFFALGSFLIACIIFLPRIFVFLTN